MGWVEFQRLGDARGGLVAIEIGDLKDVGFTVRRIYYIFHTEPGVSRGFHAHKHLKQILIPVAGSCRLTIDDGKKRTDVLLNDPKKGFAIKSMIWREMHDFSPDCVLLVLASEHYDESDYIRSYNDFLELIHAQNSSAS